VSPKDVIALVVLVLSFGLLVPYVVTATVPPDVILLIAAPAISGVLAYYFGAHNGNITGLAASAVQVSNMAAQLASQAIEKRSAAQAAPQTVVVAPTTTAGSQQP
jgi:hypothetical protein